jgi:hypothetical protein
MGRHARGSAGHQQRQLVNGMTDHERFGQLRQENELEEAMRQALEDPLTKWRREADEQEARFARERRRRERSAEPAPINLDLRISEAIAEERQHLHAVIAETIAVLAERQRDAIDDAMRPLRVELAELRIGNCELRAANTELREQLLAGRGTDLPSPLHGRVN